MKTSITFTALSITALMLCRPSMAQDRLVINGNIIAFAGEQRPTGMLIASDGEQMPIRIGRRGQFKVNMPADDRYQVHFTRPGCEEKVIVVDGHGACRNGRDRIVRFDVELRKAPDDMQAYQAGWIAFDGVTGRLLVDQAERELIAVE